MLNPLAHLIDVSRRFLIHGEPPAAGTVLGLALANGVLGWLSWRLFKTVEPKLAEDVCGTFALRLEGGSPCTADGATPSSGCSRALPSGAA
jgi:hypothetical protein